MVSRLGLSNFRTMVSLHLEDIRRHLRHQVNCYHLILSWFWVFKNGWPGRHLTFIGVTGTDGKTTTSHLIYNFLQESGLKVALISTVAATIGKKKIDTGSHVTSPDARSLQPLLRQIRNQGFTHVIIEATSHGLDQNRFAGIKFETAVLTNITPEHLDYHQTMARYQKAKAKLFRDVRFAILNRDDSSFKYFKKIASKAKIIPYAKSTIEITNPHLQGDYNLYNLAAAVAVAKIYTASDATIHKVISKFKGIPGRREEIKLGQKFRVIIDFAHTPNALRQLLIQLKKELPQGKRLILVFGCAGHRDHQKRPQMGKIAHQLTDKVIITIEDPRNENLSDIFKQITSNIPLSSQKIIRNDNRQKAIDLAFTLAESDDIIVITGKGHEKTMCVDGIEYPWSDQSAVRNAVKQLQ